MKGFGSYLKEAVRRGNALEEGNGLDGTKQEDGIEPQQDWSAHYVNYSNLKSALSEYAKRRKLFHRLWRYRRDGKLFTENEQESWNRLMAQLYLPPPQRGNGQQRGQKKSSRFYSDRSIFLPDQTTNYIEFEDEEYPSTSAPETTTRDVEEHSSYSATLRLRNLERNDFSNLLQNEITKCSTFFQSKISLLRTTLKEMNHDETQSTTTTLPSAETDSHAHMVRFHALGNELLELFAFEVVNVIAIRQIMIRHDAFVRTFDAAQISEWRLQQDFKLKSADQPDHFQKLFSLDELEELRSIFLSNYEKRYPQSLGTSRYLQRFCSQWETFIALLDKSSQSVERAAAGHVIFRDRFIGTLLKLRQYLVLGSTSLIFLSSFDPSWARMSGRHLKKEMEVIAQWRSSRESRKVDEEESIEFLVGESIESRRDDQLDTENVVPLILNLISCFLFMCNNYVIEPSSAYYANALGVNDALSGLMIGMASWFALSAAVGYSFWTNRSYREPILFAGLLMVIGNWMYANAYSYESIDMCLLGRAVQGLGAPRIINRRYVADATPFALRTASSAAFATATALGAALGPGLAILLDRVQEFDFHVPLLGTQYFNGMTGPGYFMALAWGLYSIAIVMLFREPKRSGLDELRRRERLAEHFATSAHQDDSEGDSSSQQIVSKQVSQISDCNDFENIDDSESISSNAESDNSYRLSDPTADEPNNIPYWLHCGLCNCTRHITHAVALCMFLILVKRIALESIVGSTSIVTKNRYDWSIQNVGTLHLVNGLIVIPVTIFAGYLSQFHEDRYLSLWFLSITLVGMLFLVDVTDLRTLLVGNRDDPENNDRYNEDQFLAVGPAQYVVGSLISFSGIEACESFVASLMTKVTPSSLAQGTFNSGLLTTLVGTGGRAVGDLFITFMGLISIRHLLNLLIIPGTLLVLLSIILIRRNYAILAV